MARENMREKKILFLIISLAFVVSLAIVLSMQYTLTQIERFAAEVGASFYSSRAGVLSYVLTDGKSFVSFREVSPGKFSKI